MAALPRPRLASRPCTPGRCLLPSRPSSTQPGWRRGLWRGWGAHAARCAAGPGERDVPRAQQQSLRRQQRQRRQQLSSGSSVRGADSLLPPPLAQPLSPPARPRLGHTLLPPDAAAVRDVGLQTQMHKVRPPPAQRRVGFQTALWEQPSGRHRVLGARRAATPTAPGHVRLWHGPHDSTAHPPSALPHRWRAPRRTRRWSRLPQRSPTLR
jgi:hypothetical protein